MAPKKPDKDKQFECSECKKILTDQKSYYLHTQLHKEDYPFSCDKCSYKCKIKKYLSRHKKKVHCKPDGPQCPMCLKVFHFSSALKNHMRVHTGEKPYECKVCGKAFSSTYCLSMHKMIHTNEKPFQCSFCNYACRDNSTLRRHEERHRGIFKTFPCMKCKKIFKKSATLKIHIDEIHFGIDTRIFRCDQCDRGFKTKAALRTHIRAVHEQLLKIECEICNRIISKNNVNTHLKSHVDIRPYECSFKGCGKSFKDQGTLKKHTLIHYPEHQYKCDLCDSRFCRKIRLREHKLRHEARGYTCDHCGVSFNKKTVLRIHIKRRHGTSSEIFTCDVCGLVNYSRRSIIFHLRYGHGSEYDKTCQICGKVCRNCRLLKEHYLKTHNVRYVIKKKKDDIKIKEEPVEVSAEFEFNYEVQKIEIDEHVPDPGYVDMETTMEYSKQVLEEDLTMCLLEDNAVITEYDQFCMEQVKDLPNLPRKEDHKPEYVDTETTLAYSKKVLAEDISRSIIERDSSRPESHFDEFFIQQIMDKPKKKSLPKRLQVLNKDKLANMKNAIDKMLDESKLKKEVVALEKLRRMYNRRIVLATNSGGKKVPTQIKYLKTQQNIETETDKPQSDTEDKRDNGDDISPLITSDDESPPITNQDESPPITNHVESPHITNDDESPPITNHDESPLITNHDESPPITNHDKSPHITNNDTQDTNDLQTRRLRMRKVITNDDGDDQYDKDDGGDENKNGKLTFIGHECYICFKIFKTKSELKKHSSEHFDICNEKMLKKCPYCDYVTDKNIKRHIVLVHKTQIKYDYGHVLEKQNCNGSKYVFDIGNDCELEVIPSISNLNKIACMKFDEKTRQNKNLFLGKTKLVKKGGGWVVEKEAVSIDHDYILPAFSEEEYHKLKIKGDTYLDRIKKLSYLAKKRGVKMLYPCSGCDKICQTMAALKLHNRKHETNPKRFKPKVWINRHIEYKTKNRKNGKKTIRRPVVEKPIENRKKISIEHRFESPQPIKNNHKCDKQLIEFYKTNIKGGDIEFWQFLKIFNKMSRENVNDFKDLENRDDLHFGLHFTEPVITENIPEITEKVSDTTLNQSKLVNKPVISCKKTKTIGKKTIEKKFTRAIMISKKEYMRRNEIKNQMRKRIAENKA